MSGIVIVLEWSSFPDLENRQLASRGHKVGIKWNITRQERNKDLPSFIHEAREKTGKNEIISKMIFGVFCSYFETFFCSGSYNPYSVQD